jgi:hypothetical protein
MPAPLPPPNGAGPGPSRKRPFIIGRIWCDADDGGLNAVSVLIRSRPQIAPRPVVRGVQQHVAELRHTQPLPVCREHLRHIEKPAVP